MSTASLSAPGQSIFLPGMVLPYAGSVASGAPSGWLVCDGTQVSRSTYAALFAVCGTTYGVGDGSTTFNLPDLCGRTVIGAGNGSGLTARALGASLGVETHVLSTAEMPAHTHAASSGNFVASASPGGAALAGGTGYQQIASTASTGGGGAHQNMQPSLALSYIIKT